MSNFLAVLIAFAAITLSAQIPQRLNDSTFVYPCIRNETITSYNFVGLPLETGWTMASDLDPTGTNIDAVSRIIQGTQSNKYETASFHPYFGWVKDFPVETGGAYLINALNDFDFTVVGDSIPVQYNFIPDYNSMILPLEKSNIQLCSQLGTDMGNMINQISRFSNYNQYWETASKSFGWMNDFLINVAQPLIVRSTHTFTWPSIVKAEDINDNVNLSDTKIESGAYIAGPKSIFFRTTDEYGVDLDPGSDDLGIFAYNLTLNKTEGILWFNHYSRAENHDDTGFMSLQSFCTGYINTSVHGGAPVFREGDRIRIEVVNKSDPDTLNWTYGTAIYTLVNGGSPMFMGYEEVIPGSGDPIMLKRFEDQVVDTPEVSVSGDTLTLKWWWTPGAKGYHIYSSDEPYGNYTHTGFVHYTSSSFRTLYNWQTTVSGSRKFYHIIATNDLSKNAQKSIELIKR